MNTKTTPKDFFLHLGATAALYVAAGALINLAFSVINYYFPDALAGYFYGNAVAWPISMLVVLVPTFYALEWIINRDIKAIPEKADLLIRKWRIYLTLFLAAILMGGDLIALINTYLNGEITSRFVWKAIVVLFVAGSIGKYYYFSLNTSHRFSKLARQFNAWFGIVIVIAAIVAGFIAVGSPAKQRAIRFDAQRINDLSSVQWRVVSYWQQKGKLPEDLSSLNDGISGFIVPTDPETKAAYEYMMRPATSTKAMPAFALCATFSEKSQDLAGRGAYGTGKIGYPVAYDVSVSYRGPTTGISDVWTHDKGRVCFDRTIDPDVYQVIKPAPVRE